MPASFYNLLTTATLQFFFTLPTQIQLIILLFSIFVLVNLLLNHLDLYGKVNILKNEVYTKKETTTNTYSFVFLFSVYHFILRLEVMPLKILFYITYIFLVNICLKLTEVTKLLCQAYIRHELCRCILSQMQIVLINWNCCAVIMNVYIFSEYGLNRLILTECPICQIYC